MLFPIKILYTNLAFKSIDSPHKINNLELGIFTAYPDDRQQLPFDPKADLHSREAHGVDALGGMLILRSGILGKRFAQAFAFFGGNKRKQLLGEFHPQARAFSRREAV